MARTHLAPSLRRLAIFLVAIALVAAISPGLAVAANGIPKPVDDAITTQENEPQIGNVLDNDINLGEGDLTVIDFVDLDPAFGTLTIEADGEYLFTPAVDWNGSTSTTYTVANGGHEKDGNILITVTPINVAPVANDDTVTVDEDTATDVTSGLLANDTDFDADTLVVSAVSNASGGNVQVVSDVVTFTPDADDCGTGAGSFDYDISDGNGGTDTGHVTVDVTCLNDAPVAVDDTASGTEDTPASIDPADLLTNDTDVDGDTLVVTAVSNDSGGSAVLDNGTITFTPDADAAARCAGFDYDISDGNSGTDTGHVAVDLGCDNDAPVAVDDTASGTEDTPASIDPADLLTNDTDVDGDTLVVTAVSNDSGGSAVLDNGTITFTPDADLCLPDAAGFDYDISDGNGGTDTGHVTVDVTCLNDAPVAVDDTASGTEDTPASIDPADLLTNDTDVDGDTLVVTAVSNDSGGSAVLDNGTITFTPDADDCGTGAGTFDYDISDRNGGTDTGHVTVDVTCPNDAPVAVDDTGSVANNPGPTDFDVLANDTDPDGNSLSLVSASVSASAGSASVVAGKVHFTPLAAFSGPAAITYVVSDGSLTDSGTLTVTVGPDTVDPAATAPTVHFGTGRVDESAPLLIFWSSSDVGSGVVAHELQVSIAGGSFTTIYSGAGTSYTKLFPFNKSLVWRVRATDAAGNDSAWATSATRKVVPYQRNSKSIAYTGTWTNVTSAGSSGTGYAYTTTLGKRALLTFTGLEVLYVAPKTSASGYAKVYADGTLIGRFNLRASSTRLGQIITRKTWGASGSHTMRVTNDQSGRRTGLDVFVVLK